MVRPIGNDKTLDKAKDIFNKYSSKTHKQKEEKVVDVHRDNLINLLQSKHFWKEIKKSLTNQEMTYFENEWVNYCSQFADIVYTDEITIKDAILMEIELNRISVEKKEILDEVQEIDSEIKKAQKNKDDDAVRNLRARRNELRSMTTPIQKKYLDTLQRKDERFKALKANREQRFRKTIETTTNIFELIKQLSDMKERMKINKELSLHNDAVEIERKRLMKPTKFADDIWDSQLLNAETIDALEEYDVSDDNNAQPTE